MRTARCAASDSTLRPGGYLACGRLPTGTEELDMGLRVHQTSRSLLREAIRGVLLPAVAHLSAQPYSPQTALPAICN